MADVRRFATHADVSSDDGDPRTMSVSAIFRAALDDGRSLSVFDRGWTHRLHGEVPAGADAWSLASAADVEEMARVVVGPDEPMEGVSQDQAEDEYWDAVVEELRAQGVTTDAARLRELPHDVVLSERLAARLGTER